MTIDYSENSYLILTGPPCINQNTLSACDIKPTQIRSFLGGQESSKSEEFRGRVNFKHDWFQELT